MKGRSACACAAPPPLPPLPPPPPPRWALASFCPRRSPLLSCSAVASSGAPENPAPAPRPRPRPRPAATHQPGRPPPARPGPAQPGSAQLSARRSTPPSLAPLRCRSACARRCGHEWLELLHRQPDGGQHLPGRGHRGLQGRALRLGRRPGKDLRQHHALGSERPGREGPQQPLRERADAGRAEVLGHSGQPARGRGEHHGPADKELRWRPHLQHYGRHDQQDNRPRHGEGGHPRRLHQQEVLRDGQPLAAVAVLTRLLVPSVVLLMERFEDVQDGSDRPGPWPRHRGTGPGTRSPHIPTSPAHGLLPPLLPFFSNAPTLPKPSSLVFFLAIFFLPQILIAAKFSGCYKV